MSGDRWREFYRERDYDQCIYREGEAMIDYLDTVFERFGTPESVLSVGCGPAVLEFELAERYPDTAFVCVDVAEQVIEDYRDRARERGIDNISFRVGELPDLDIGRQFELVAAGENIWTAGEITALFEEPVEDYGETVGASDALDEAIYLQKQ